MIKRILLAFLGFYRRWLSPAIHLLSPWGCRYRPTCSEFAIEAVMLHGAARGGWMALGRLLRCHPFARSGFDPVPLPSSIAHLEHDRATARSLHDPLP
jgi:putative membrane protein insertion efficiency factor